MHFAEALLNQGTEPKKGRVRCPEFPSQLKKNQLLLILLLLFKQLVRQINK